MLLLIFTYLYIFIFLLFFIHFFLYCCCYVAVEEPSLRILLLCTRTIRCTKSNSGCDSGLSVGASGGNRVDLLLFGTALSSTEEHWSQVSSELLRNAVSASLGWEHRISSTSMYPRWFYPKLLLV